MSEIELHYDEKHQNTVEERQFSSIYNLKCFNNWIKAVLINEFVPRSATVLDLCCGKGGDLIKWSKVKVSKLLGLDISSISIEQCKDRFLQMNEPFYAQFIAIDCFTKDVLSLPCFQTFPLGSFDVISCQFAFHYCFRNKESFLQTLQTISMCLKSKGVFFATIPDSEVIFERLRKSHGVSFGNSLYKIEFEQKKEFVKYGQQYRFYLEDAINDCPEYMVHIETLSSYAQQYGLRLRYVANFSQFYQKYREKYSALMSRMMKNLSKNQREYGHIMPPEEWEVCTLYLAVIFEKN